MSNPEKLERRSAQAILATYLQMARYGELARHLQRTRERAIEHRMRQATDLDQATRLQQQLEAQQGQSATLDNAMERLHARTSELSSFAEAGLTYEDFKRLGLENVVAKEEIDAAHLRGVERRKSAEATSPPASDAAGEAASTTGEAAPSAQSGPETVAARPAHRSRRPDPTVNVDLPPPPAAVAVDADQNGDFALEPTDPAIDHATVLDEPPRDSND